MNIKKKTYIATMAIIALTTLSSTIPAFAETTTIKTNNGSLNSQFRRNNGKNKANMKPGIIGTVVSVSGNTITITGKQGFDKNKTNTTTYTIDATNAKITKENVAGTISSIVAGDTIMAEGTVTGTNIVATTIRDGVMNGVDKTKIQGKDNMPAIIGNGDPVIVGKVSTINGSIVTILNKNNVSYTIDVTSAKISQGQNTILVSNIAVGDTLIAQGAVTGTNIVASTVIDQSKTVTTTTTEQPKGFFGNIGSFFKNLFGF